MSYAETVNINNFNIDAFGRLRVSNPVTQLDLKQLYDSLPLLYDTQLVSGTGTRTYYTDRATDYLSVNNLQAGEWVKQSKMRGFYQPGKGILCYITATEFGTATGVTKELGYFDDNNGIFFRSSAGTLSVVRRSQTTGVVVDSVVTQANWNLDKLDGTGPSGYTLDPEKANIYGMDFEWLGTGGVRYFVVIDNKTIFVHQLYNANSLSTPYMTTPNLPIRYGIQNDGTGANDDFGTICGSIISEGGNDDTVKPVCATRGTTVHALSTTTGEFTPLISIRLKYYQAGARINPEEISLFCPTASRDFMWKLILNPTITLPSGSSDAASWQNIDNSSLQYDITRDNTHVVTGGYELGFGFGASSAQVKSSVTGINRSYLTLGSNIDTSVDEIVLAVAQATTSLATNMLGGIRVGEYI